MSPVGHSLNVLQEHIVDSLVVKMEIQPQGKHVVNVLQLAEEVPAG